MKRVALFVTALLLAALPLRASAEQRCFQPTNYGLPPQGNTFGLMPANCNSPPSGTCLRHVESFSMGQTPPYDLWIAIPAYWKMTGCQFLDYTGQDSNSQPMVRWLYGAPNCSTQYFCGLPSTTPVVGVIPDANGCPSSTVRFYMDNEDSNAASSVYGWVGGTVLDGYRNTHFVFCPVNGVGFRDLATYSTGRANYAVLKLSEMCPVGAVEITRYFDNEDNNNKNSSSGTIFPNTWSTKGIELHFCLFKGDGPTQSSMPTLGYKYGVFAGTDFGFTSATGSIYTDDEDNKNANWYSPANASWKPAALQIISEGKNTLLRTALVSYPVCSDNVCNGLENETTCPADCDVCGNGSCSATEDVFTCPADCGWCGDSICSWIEDVSSCSVDCGGFCGDGVCSTDEDPWSCYNDCGGFCGDSICDWNEDWISCPWDC